MKSWSASQGYSLLGWERVILASTSFVGYVDGGDGNYGLRIENMCVILQMIYVQLVKYDGFLVSLFNCFCAKVVQHPGFMRGCLFYYHLQLF